MRNVEKDKWEDRVLTFSERLNIAQEFALKHIYLERDYKEHFADQKVSKDVEAIKKKISYHEGKLIKLNLELNNLNQSNKWA